MFCFRIKRRLYDFLEGNLHKAGAQKIKAHLQRCPDCAEEYRQQKQLLGLVSQKATPEPSSEFWTNFNRELNERLTKETILPKEFKLRPRNLARVSLKPAFALGLVAILLITLSFYLFGGLPTKGRLTALSEERIMNDIEILEELTGELTLPTEDFLLEELDLIEELG